MPFNCRWIFSVLNKAISKIVLSLDSFKFFDAATALYSWWQFQLCDVFIEIITPYFAGNNPTFASAKRSAQNTLRLCLDYDLLLLHLFMPTVTEELWQHLPSKIDYVRKESILISEYPSIIKSWTNDVVELEVDMVESVVISLSPWSDYGSMIHFLCSHQMFSEAKSLLNILVSRKGRNSTVDVLAAILEF